MNSELGLKETIIINARLVSTEAELNQAALGLKKGLLLHLFQRAGYDSKQKKPGDGIAWFWILTVISVYRG